MNRYENTDPGHYKFWEIEVRDSAPPSAVVRWGRIGTRGQSQIKTFSSVEEAAQFGEDKINEKLARGYLPV